VRHCFSLVLVLVLVLVLMLVLMLESRPRSEPDPLATRHRGANSALATIRGRVPTTACRARRLPTSIAAR
jgi:hypothetical protein